MKKNASLSILAKAGSGLATSTAFLFLLSTGCDTHNMRSWSNTSLKLGCEYSAQLLQPAAWKASWSPDDQRLAYCKQGGGISVFDLATRRVTDLVPKGQDPAWSTDGKFIAYVTAGNQEYLAEEVWMVPVSGGDPVKVGDGGFPTWSADGSLVIYHSRKLNQILSAKVNALDEPPAVFFEKPFSWYPAISPDGSRIAFGVQDKLMVVERATGKTLASLATPGEHGLLPCWSPDGRRVAFGGFAGSRAGLWIFDVERGGAFQVAKNPGCTMPAWSPDGKILAFDLRGGTNEIWLVKTKDSPAKSAADQTAPVTADSSSRRPSVACRIARGQAGSPMFQTSPPQRRRVHSARFKQHQHSAFRFLGHLVRTMPAGHAIAGGNLARICRARRPLRGGEFARTAGDHPQLPRQGWTEDPCGARHRRQDGRSIPRSRHSDDGCDRSKPHRPEGSRWCFTHNA